MANTYNDVLRNVTQGYLITVQNLRPRPDPAQIEENLLAATKLRFDLENANLPRGEKWKILKTLAPVQLALIMLMLYDVRSIRTGGSDADKQNDLLAIYQEDGDDEGTYSSSEQDFWNIMQQYHFSMNTNEFKEAMNKLRSMAPRVDRCSEPNLIAVNNGIYDFDKKVLMPFDPAYVFLAKCHVDYVPNAANVVIHNDDDGTDWDVESWMQELSDDPEIVNLLWEILGAIIRPFVHWNKSAWFYSETGNNGKGTLCELMRQLCGDGSYAVIPLSAMGKEFMLEQLPHSSAIIVDENDVGIYIDKAANLKAIITNDVIQLNRKHKSAISYQFFGFMVQCLNEMPRVKDKSGSFLRRQLFVPFTKCFTGVERKYIKNDYLHRREVLEYVLKRVLNMDYYELSEPQACKLALAEYREHNDTVLQFAEDILPEVKWDLLPFTFLYELYRAWFERNVPSGVIQSYRTFRSDIYNLVSQFPDWECESKTHQYHTGSKMDAPEPLIAQYDLKGWMNPAYKGPDVDKLCHPPLSASYRGITRVQTSTVTDSDDSDSGD